MRILIAEDSPDARALLEKVITSQPDRQIVFATDGAAAWWHLTNPNDKFDAGIFDISMPGVDGLALLARVRKDPRFTNFPVIVCTGNTDRATVSGAASLNITSYIVKPVNPASLLQKLAALEAKLVLAT